jgi:hypothetical protein
MEILFLLCIFKAFGIGSLCMFTECMWKISAYLVTDDGIQEENGSQ